MTVELLRLIDDQKHVDDADSYMHLVHELRETAEDVRIREVSPVDRHAMVQAAEFLLASPVNDELDTLISVSASTTVVTSPRLEHAYKTLLDNNFPLDTEELSRLAITANQQSREQFETARNTTDDTRSFGTALIHAGYLTEAITGLGTDEDLLRKNWKTISHDSSNKPKKIPAEIKRLLYEDTNPRTMDEHGLFGGHITGQPSYRVSERPETVYVNRTDDPTGKLDLRDLRNAA